MNSIARWDGETWSDVGGGVTGPVREIVDMDLLPLPSADGGGALVVGGGFSFAGGVPANRLARWNGDTWQPLGGGISGPSQFVLAVKAFSHGGGDPLLYVGGQFDEAGGQKIRNLAAWAGGNTWLAVGEPSSQVRSLDTWDDGGGNALYIGGAFSKIDHQVIERITRFDGVEFRGLGAGVRGSVRVVRGIADSFGSGLYVAGMFDSAGGAPADGVARWGCFGSADLDGDGTVGFPDLLRLLAEWGPCPAPPESCIADLDGDGEVGFADLLIVVQAWSR